MTTIKKNRKGRYYKMSSLILKLVRDLTATDYKTNKKYLYDSLTVNHPNGQELSLEPEDFDARSLIYNEIDKGKKLMLMFAEEESTFENETRLLDKFFVEIELSYEGITEVQKVYLKPKTKTAKRLLKSYLIGRK
jgi:hypothetical protein